MSIAPAAPAIPLVSMFLLGLLGLLCWAIQRGLLGIWVHSFGALLQGLANLLKYDRGIIHIDFGGPIRALDHTVRNALRNGATKSEHLAGYFFHGCAVIVRWTAKEIDDLAGDTLAWATWFQNSHLPKWVKAAVYAAFPPALILRLVTAAIHANLPHVGRTIIEKVGITRAQVKALIALSLADIAAPTLPKIRIPWRVRDIEHDLSAIKARLRSLEKAAGLAVTAGLAYRLLHKLKLGCLAGRNGKAVAKRLCGIDPGLIDALLIGTTILGVRINLRDFAHEVEDITEEVSGLIHALIIDTAPK